MWISWTEVDEPRACYTEWSQKENLTQCESGNHTVSNTADLFYSFSSFPLASIYDTTQFISVQLLSRVRHFATPWTTARQASLSITNSQSPPKPMSIELVMPSNHLIVCRPFLLLPSIFPSIRVFSNESALRIRWSKYWSFQSQHQSFQWTFRTDFL